MLRWFTLFIDVYHNCQQFFSDMLWLTNSFGEKRPGVIFYIAKWAVVKPPPWGVVLKQTKKRDVGIGARTHINVVRPEVRS